MLGKESCVIIIGFGDRAGVNGERPQQLLQITHGIVFFRIHIDTAGMENFQAEFYAGVSITYFYRIVEQGGGS